MVNQVKRASIKLADIIAAFIGSWTFIIIQSIILTIWVVINVCGVAHFDPYPFILLNLFLSFEAAYATPLILMSSNVQAIKDRKQMTAVLKIDKEDHEIIQDLKHIITDLHADIKLDRQSLRDHKRLESEHLELKQELAELKQLINKLLVGAEGNDPSSRG